MLGVLALSLSASVAAADTCPNAALRFGASANLPDCRAYELVTPRYKEDNSTISAIHGFPDGEHIFYTSLLPLPGAQNGQEEEVLGSRTQQGWITTPLTPPAGPGEPVGYGLRSGHFGLNFELIKTASFAANFSAAFVNSSLQYGELDQTTLFNAFRVDIPSGVSSIESLPDSGPMTEALLNPPNIASTTTSPEFEPGAFIAGNASNGSRVYFETTVQLPTAPGTPQDDHLSGNELFERYDGHTYIVGVLPDGSVPACGAQVGTSGNTSSTLRTNGYSYDDSGTISPDGSNVVFSSPSDYSNGSDCPGVPFKYYLREDNDRPDATTIELPGVYIGRTPDQQKLFLVNGEELYEYDIATGQSVMVGQVPPLREAESSGLLGSSADGSVVYTSPGEHSGGDLSIYENGAIKSLPIPVAGLLGQNFLLPRTNAMNRPSVSPDGSRLAFVDSENLTSYQSRAHHEVYVYNATSGTITCISCNPDGTPPTLNSGLLAGEKAGFFKEPETAYPQNLVAPDNRFTSGMYPAVSSDDEHIFFNSQEGLVPQDTNGLNDAYEWEPIGVGNCGALNVGYSPVSGGCVYLLSSGTGSNGSWIAGVSEDGRDVFLVSNDSLTPEVSEASQQLYDARVDGGFPYTPPGHGCDSGECQGPQTEAPSLLAPPPSATFNGVGNPSPEATVTVKANGRKHAKHAKKKHKKKKQKGRARKSGKRGRRK